jgi:hypothetical protein
VAAPGFEPGKAKPADLQRATFIPGDQRLCASEALTGDRWGNPDARIAPPAARETAASTGRSMVPRGSGA